MKQLSVILNVILLIAVGVLYYLHFSEGKSPKAKVKSSISSSSVKPENAVQHNGIAFVEMDSLMEKITDVKSKRKEFENEQKAIENEWNSNMKALVSKKDEYEKKAASATPEEIQKMEADLYKQQQSIENRKQERSQNLAEATYKFTEELQKKIRDFMTSYNEDKQFKYVLSTGTGLDYILFKDSTMNITQDVIDGMNEKMKEGGK